ncbi:hypothetical protein HPY28_13360 [Brevibacillus sp. HB1.2]|uniref:hypothetical protein n=1 Tax=Brevibacillus TaxID=55080 RepID=UPI00035E8F58|nr:MULTISPECIES: hypothetical protein [unclassified Brevibacillus]ATF11161.1 hypothetical protein A616_03810 [Brevibacillus brevis X23]MDC0761174.1 hypothetical protein [Brevibacillus sp. AG]NRS17022.1 hypothetical protein [Brevibacillus sp. HB1.4B]NTU21310.1 hypothetical protein [Brevibacillus sp. HB1.2]NTU30596.1 hypothetical protein [Brevibacillus sp. HB1.1]
MRDSKKAVLYVVIISALAEFLLGEDIDREGWEELSDAFGMVGMDLNEVFTENDSLLFGFQKVCQEFGKMNITEEMIEELYVEDQLE